MYTLVQKLQFAVTTRTQRVAVGPGNAHFSSIRQVSSDAATPCPPLLQQRAAIRQFSDY